MRFTKNRINLIHEGHDALRERIDGIWDATRQGGSFHSIERITDDSIVINVSVYQGCGEYESEERTIPMKWVTAEDWGKVVKADMDSYREEQARIEAEKKAAAEQRAAEQRAIQAEKQRQREIAELARLKSLYEPNQGDTP